MPRARQSSLIYRGTNQLAYDYAGDGTHTYRRQAEYRCEERNAQTIALSH